MRKNPQHLRNCTILVVYNVNVVNKIICEESERIWVSRFENYDAIIGSYPVRNFTISTISILNGKKLGK